MKLTYIITLLTFSVLITACGGSDSDNEQLTISQPTTEKLYSGSTNPALLTTDNTEKFASLLLGDSFFDETLYNKNTLQSKAILKDQLTVIGDTLAVINSTISPTTQDLQQRVVTESVECKVTGTAQVQSDTISSSEYTNEVTGKIIYTFDNCQQSMGNILNGVLFIIINSSSYPESYTIGYDDFQVTQGTDVFSLNGTVQLFDTTDYGTINTRTRRETINLLSVHDLSGIETLLENYEIETTINRYGATSLREFSTVTGKTYISDQGYITTTTSEDFGFFLSDSQDSSYIPYKGNLYLNGASQSSARVPENDYQLDSEFSYRLDLDQDGDGGYELISIQDRATLEGESFTINEPPIANIRAKRYTEDTSGFPYSTDTYYIFGETVYLYAHAYDNDNDDSTLSYAWTVEESPLGSSAEIITLQDDIREGLFTPDVKGSYKFSLKVSDPLGSRQNSIVFMEIDIPNHAPNTYISISNFRTRERPIALLSLGETLNFDYSVKDIDTPKTENLSDGMVITYEWLQKPAGSQATLQPSDESYEYDDYEKEWEYRVWYSITPDKLGRYTLRITATDLEGASDVSLLELDVVTEY